MHVSAKRRKKKDMTSVCRAMICRISEMRGKKTNMILLFLAPMARAKPGSISTLAATFRLPHGAGQGSAGQGQASQPLLDGTDL